MDRAFDWHRIVILHGYAGSGKSTTAIEFAEWYWNTAGQRDAIVYSSFEVHTTLEILLDQFGRICDHLFGAYRDIWSTSSYEEKKQFVFEVLKNKRVLWIWDNVEALGGFPLGAETMWASDERREIVDFVQQAKATKARFLFVSRRSKEPLFETSIYPVSMSPMRPQDRAALARSLARAGSDLNTEMWGPLLEFSQGNPLAITAIVDNAVRNKASTEEEVAHLVSDLKAGIAVFEGEVGRSLDASLRYGFDQAFADGECKKLALLILFQGFVNLPVFQILSRKDQPYALEAIEEWSEEELIDVLDRANEIGLLRNVAGNAYKIHPAYPGFFRSEFEKFYDGFQADVTRAFVAGIAGWANFLMLERERGEVESIALLGLRSLTCTMRSISRLATSVGGRVWRHARVVGVI